SGASRDATRSSGQSRGPCKRRRRSPGIWLTELPRPARRGDRTAWRPVEEMAIAKRLGQTAFAPRGELLGQANISQTDTYLITARAYRQWSRRIGARHRPSRGRRRAAAGVRPA